MNIKLFIGITLLAGITLPACVSSLTNAEDFKLTIKDNKLSLNTSEIFIQNGGMSVSILENNKPVVLIAEGKPDIKKIHRITPLGKGEETRFSWKTKNGYLISWIITNIGSDIVAIKSEFSNQTSNNVFLDQFSMLNTPEEKFWVKGRASDWMLTSTDVESRRWGTLDKDIPTDEELHKEGAYSRNYFSGRSTDERKSDRKWRCYYSDISLYREPGLAGMIMAAVDTVADVFFEVKVNDVKMTAEIISEMSEVEVAPGETRSSDEVLLIAKPWSTAQQMKNNWIKSVTGARIQKEPMFGWCSWYRSAMDIKSSDVITLAQYITANRNRLPYEVIQIDEGWQVKRGVWTENEKFTCGLQAVADSIKKSSSVAGIWLSPVTPDYSNNKRLFPEEWYANYKNGTASEHKLDPTHPDAIKVMVEGLRYSYEKGYRYFKLDFSTLPYDYKRFYNPKFTRLQAQRALFRLYRQAIGDDTYLLACGISEQRSLVPYADADRIGTDCGPFGGFARQLASDNQPVNIWGFWYPIISIANKCHENGVLSIGDPDVTFTGQTGLCRPLQLRTWHSFVGIYGGLALTSDYPFQEAFGSDDNVRMMEILYPVSTEKGHNFAGGWDMYGKEFGYNVKRDYGTFTNVIIWNHGHCTPKDLGIKNVPTEDIGKKFHAWSFWDESYKGVVSAEYIAKNVPVYEHELLRLTPLCDKPVIVGSNLHISMGATEIKAVNHSQNKMTIELDPDAGARNGRIYIYSEENLCNASSSNSEVTLVKEAEKIYLLILNNRLRDKKEVISLSISDEETKTLENALKNEDIQSRYGQSSFSDDWVKSW